MPQFCVIVRKAYGAGLYAMGGPGFGPDATIALPTARIAVMGPEAAVNAVYANKIAEIADPERAASVRPGPPARVRGGRRPRAARRPTSCSTGIIEADELRAELLHRLRYAARRDRAFSERRRGVPPV